MVFDNGVGGGGWMGVGDEFYVFFYIKTGKGTVFFYFRGKVYNLLTNSFTEKSVFDFFRICGKNKKQLFFIFSQEKFTLH